MRRLALHALFYALLSALAATPAAAQPTNAQGLSISWEVQNRFRLFREARDFALHVEALKGRSIAESELVLAEQSEGRGWSRNMIGRLCIDPAGRIAEPCQRDGMNESYLAPVDHPVIVRLTGPVDPAATCAWTFNDGDTSTETRIDCAQGVRLRARFGRPTVAAVEIANGDNEPRRLITEILVRDLLVAGLGDSIGSGEGNPDRAVELADTGFCFRHFLSSTARQFFRPGRLGYKGSNACDNPTESQQGRLLAWQRHGARWFNAACHRSLYSYQTRAAIALAARDPHIAVTYLPLACTGATIAEGILGAQQASECVVGQRGVNCQGSVPPQLAALREALNTARARYPQRQIDLILLSIGANDIGFSGLVADVIVEASTERALFRRTGVIGSIEASREYLRRELPAGFAALRDALKSFVGDLARVVYVSYANPALAGESACRAGRDGFDVHPAFHVAQERLDGVVRFVQSEFLPRLKALARCEAGVLCRDANADRMTFVDDHQPRFAGHGFCARASTDPDFDKECFSERGESFQSDPVEGAVKPLLCDRRAAEFRAYAPRARWIRTANDSYFAAMTYPQGLPSTMQASDIHDATWGVLSAVYGGAIHPTAQGHAAMADAAFAAAEAILARSAPVPSGPAAPSR